MDRLAYEDLCEWKNSKDRKPLIIRGVRQCGKTYLMKEFGKNNYGDTVYLEFSGNEFLCRIFDGDLVPERIISALSIKIKKKITENTLLIFDEIQACPRALSSLKYFNESAPEYDIICAGSLLGLQGEGSFPVGKVTFLNMYPMNFREFVNAAEPDLLKYIDEFGKDEFSADRLSSLYGLYRAIGGMPEAVSKWLDTNDMCAVDTVLNNICDSYRLDFLKHVPEKDIKKINLIWSSIPDQLAKENRRFFFGHAVKGSRAKNLEDSLQWLVDAGMVHKVQRIERPTKPLPKTSSDNMFKLYMMDIGVMRVMAGASASDAIDSLFDDRFEGGFTENLVACELVSYGYSDLHYWSSGNAAEVDFVFQSGNDIIPTEVKSGRHYRAASLNEYIDRYSPSKAIVISEKGPMVNGIVTTVPLNMIWIIDGWIRRPSRH